MGVTWRDGRLAGKQLFDALAEAGIEPLQQRYDNLFEQVEPRLFVRRLRAAIRRGYTVVALGNKVAAGLTRLRVAHVPMVHPAARGRIRRKDRYAAHVAETLARTA